jgi:hypothetical protein
MSTRSAALSAAALALVGACVRSADAQEFWSPSSSSSSPRIEPGPSREARGFEASLSVQGRFSLLGGTVDPDLGAHYNDLFKPGLGVQVEGSLLWPVGPKWHVGPYLSVGWDSYEGKTFTDSVGDTLAPDKMDMMTFLVGVRSVYDVGQHFSWDGHLGLGASHSATVDGVVTLSGVPMDVQVFKSSTAFAFDLGTRFAYQAGPVVFDAGLGVRIQGAPGNADLNFNSGPIVAFEVEFGVGILF